MVCPLPKKTDDSLLHIGSPFSVEEVVWNNDRQFLIRVYKVVATTKLHTMQKAIKTSKAVAFDHLRSFPTDNRSKLRAALAEDVLDEEKIRWFVDTQAKTFRYAYFFAYPSHWRKQSKEFSIHPLARVVALPETSLELVQLVYNVYPDAISSIDEAGRLPIHYVARFGKSRAILEFLLEKFPESISFATQDRILTLHYAVSNSEFDVETVKWLVSLYPEAVEQASLDKWLPLHFAVQHHRDEAVSLYLLDMFPESAKMPKRGGNLALHIALGARYTTPINLIKELLRVYPQSIKIANGGKFCALHSFLSGNANDKSLELLQILLVAYPEATKRKSKSKRTPLPLHIACKYNLPIDIIKRLLEEYPGAVREENGHGMAVLALASEMSVNPKVLRLLEKVEENLDELKTFTVSERHEPISELARQAEEDCLVETNTRDLDNDNDEACDVKEAANDSAGNTVQANAAEQLASRYEIKLAAADPSRINLEMPTLPAQRSSSSADNGINPREEKIAAQNLPRNVARSLGVTSSDLEIDSSATDVWTLKNEKHARSATTMQTPPALVFSELPSTSRSILPDQVPLNTTRQPQEVEARQPGAFGVAGPASNSRRDPSPTSHTSSVESVPVPEMAFLEEPSAPVAAFVPPNVTELENEVEMLRKKLAESERQERENNNNLGRTGKGIVVAEPVVANQCCIIL